MIIPTYLDRLDIGILAFLLLLAGAVALDDFKRRPKRPSKHTNPKNNIAHILRNAKNFEL